MSAQEWLASPVALVLVTLLGYQFGVLLRDRTDGHALAQPVLTGIVVAGAWVQVFGIAYADYRAATSVISWWLGPAVVALAVPLHRQVKHLRGLVGPMLLAIPLGALVSMCSAWLLVSWLGGDEALANTMAPKTATTPVAIAVAQLNDGIPELAAVFAVTAGVLGAIAGPAVLGVARVRDHRARGLALGAVSHGIGAARAMHDNETEGAFAGLSMGLTALTVSILLPIALAIMR